MAFKVETFSDKSGFKEQHTMKRKNIILGLSAIVLIGSAAYLLMREPTAKPDAAASKTLQALDKEFPDEPSKAEPPAPADPSHVVGRPAKR